MRDEDFSRQQEIAATLSDDDLSDRAAVARGATLRGPAVVGRGGSAKARTSNGRFEQPRLVDPIRPLRDGPLPRKP
jgi:hypothetical protein